MIEIGDFLKSEAVIELLDLYDTNVIYRFDRMHEGEDDSYSASNEELGLEMKFDKAQKLIVIWIKSVNSAEIKKWIQWNNFPSMADVENWAKKNNFGVRIGDNWIRADSKMVCYHYSFDSSGLSMVTLMDKNIAP